MQKRMRNKKLVILAHCLLNQHATLLGWERAEGPFSDVLSLLAKQRIAVFQLPCPELGFLGLERPPKTFEEYDTPQYKEHCKALLKPVLAQLKHYIDHDYQLLGVLGIEASPSCDILNSRGVFMQELRNVVNAYQDGRFDKMPCLDLPENLEDGGFEGYLRRLESML